MRYKSSSVQSDDACTTAPPTSPPPTPDAPAALRGDTAYTVPPLRLRGWCGVAADGARGVCGPLPNVGPGPLPDCKGPPPDWSPDWKPEAWREEEEEARAWRVEDKGGRRRLTSLPGGGFSLGVRVQGSGFNPPK